MATLRKFLRLFGIAGLSCSAFACAQSPELPNFLALGLLPTPGVSVLATLNVTEGGATDTYSLRLNQAPTAPVTIQVVPDSQLSVSTTSLTFNSSNYSTPQGVIVTAVDDLIIEGNHFGYITHSVSTSDLAFQSLNPGIVVAGITDNDSAGISLSTTTVAATEGGATGAYTVVLTFAPTASVTVTATADSQTRVNGAASAPLTFTAGACPGPGNWCVPQTITVSAVNDTVVEGAHTGTITNAATSADPKYNGLAISNVTANLTDNDAAGVSLVESGGSTVLVENGATDSINVSLTLQPSSNTTVRIDPDAQGDVGAGAGNPLDLVFTTGACPGPGNWCTAQTVTVTAVNDAVDEGDHTTTITRTVIAGPAPYVALAPVNIIATITDNDRGSVTFNTAGSVDVDELTPATADTYTIVLGYRPESNVTITVDPDLQLSVNGGGAGVATNLTFTGGAACPPANWCTAQTVSVTAIDDVAAEATPHTGVITHTVAAGSPAAYLALNPLANVNVNIADNDSDGVLMVQSGGVTNVTEGGATDTYTIKLTSDPGVNVTINIDPDAQLDLGGGADNAINLTFTTGACPGPGNWCANQTVTVTANDDGAAEANHTGVIAHSVTAGPAGYLALNPLPSITANITDNDVKRIFVTAGTWNGQTVGGIAGADAKCAADANKPAGPGVWRALMVESNLNTRIACTTANCGGGPGEHIAWVLAANQAYYRTNLTTALFTTDANGIFVFGAFTNAFGAAGTAWTGLNSNWTAQGVLLECGQWASSGPIIFGAFGSVTATNGTALSNGSTSCNGATRNLICVEQ
ncbi:MAG: DUF1554 domain-containing protein [Leptospirales bacterium]|nr:DUF1554 domain-containing protein [Leptospirales bacterium]